MPAPLLSAFVLLVSLVTVTADAAAQREERRRDREWPERIQHQLGADRFAAGGRVFVRQPVPGDLVAAGGAVNVLAPVKGDTVVAGGRVRVEADGAQDLYAAGGDVLVSGSIARNARIAGGEVEIGPRARIGGGATVAGGRVNILGPVDGYLQVGGGRVYIDAAIAGPVEAAGGRIELGPNARLAAGLRYGSDRELVRHPDAQVNGNVERFRVTRGRDLEDAAEGAGWAFLAIWIGGLMVMAVVLAALFPAYSAHAAGNARRRFGWSLLAGLLALFFVPVIVVLVAVTVIGLPLALLTGLAWVALIVTGLAVAGISLGDFAIERWRPQSGTGWRLLAAALGVLVLALVALVPILGQIVAFLALLAGMGGVLLLFRRRGEPAGA